MIGDDNNRHEKKVGPPAAQTSLILSGGREYNGFSSGDDNNRYKVEEGPPCAAQTGLILPGGREYNGFLIYYI